MQELVRPNEKRAQWAIYGICLMLGLNILAYCSDILELRLLLQSAHGSDDLTQEWANNVLLHTIVSRLNLVGNILSGILYIRWFRRAYFNLHQRLPHLQFAEGWAAGCWFVPILSLFRPYQIMSEMFMETSQLLKQRAPMTVLRDHRRLVGWWWGLWITFNILGNIRARLTSFDSDLQTFILSDYIGISLVVLFVPLTLLAVRVVQTYAGLESLLNTVSEPAMSGVYAAPGKQDQAPTF